MLKSKHCKKCKTQLTRVEKVLDKVRHLWIKPHRTIGENSQCIDCKQIIKEKPKYERNSNTKRK